MAESKENKPIDLTEKVEVVATDKAPYHKKGEKYKIHPTLVEHYEKAGYIEKQK